jgi:hypothetical protein
LLAQGLLNLLDDLERHGQSSVNRGCGVQTGQVHRVDLGQANRGSKVFLQTWL